MSAKEEMEDKVITISLIP